VTTFWTGASCDQHKTNASYNGEKKRREAKRGGREREAERDSSSKRERERESKRVKWTRQAVDRLAVWPVEGDWPLPTCVFF